MKQRWSHELVEIEAKKFRLRSEFGKYARGAYDYATRHSILNLVCEHMDIIGNRKFRCVYSYEFPDKTVYIGLTYDLKNRNDEHINNKSKKKTAVKKHIEKTNLVPILYQKTDYVLVKYAIILEKEWVKKYKLGGWEILNEVECGNVGGFYYIWNYENCEKEALKYSTRLEFQKKSGGAYHFARKNKFLDEICKHMILKIKPKNYWTKDRCKKFALKFKTRTEFKNNAQTQYQTARRNGWLDDICKHMK